MRRTIDRNRDAAFASAHTNLKATLFAERAVDLNNERRGGKIKDVVDRTKVVSRRDFIYKGWILAG